MLQITRRTLCLGAFAASCMAGPPALAADTILTVRGKIGAGGEKAYTLADLDAFPHASFATTTPWHREAVTFEGVDLQTLLDTLGANGTTLRLGALNDYIVSIELADLQGTGALLALRQNGTPMPISDKGPVFLVFPFDDRPDLQHQSFYSRAVWQLATLEIL